MIKNILYGSYISFLLLIYFYSLPFVLTACRFWIYTSCRSRDGSKMLLATSNRNFNLPARLNFAEIWSVSSSKLWWTNYFHVCWKKLLTVDRVKWRCLRGHGLIREWSCHWTCWERGRRHIRWRWRVVQLIVHCTEQDCRHSVVLDELDRLHCRWDRWHLTIRWLRNWRHEWEVLKLLIRLDRLWKTSRKTTRELRSEDERKGNIDCILATMQLLSRELIKFWLWTKKQTLLSSWLYVCMYFIRRKWSLCFQTNWLDPILST